MATQNDVKARISALLGEKGLTEHKLAGDNSATQTTSKPPTLARCSFDG